MLLVVLVVPVVNLWGFRGAYWAGSAFPRRSCELRARCKPVTVTGISRPLSKVASNEDQHASSRKQSLPKCALNFKARMPKGDSEGLSPWAALPLTQWLPGSPGPACHARSLRHRRRGTVLAPAFLFLKQRGTAGTARTSGLQGEAPGCLTQACLAILPGTARGGQLSLFRAPSTRSAVFLRPTFIKHAQHAQRRLHFFQSEACLPQLLRLVPQAPVQAPALQPRPPTPSLLRGAGPWWAVPQLWALGHAQYNSLRFFAPAAAARRIPYLAARQPAGARAAVSVLNREHSKPLRRCTVYCWHGSLWCAGQRSRSCRARAGAASKQRHLAAGFHTAGTPAAAACL